MVRYILVIGDTINWNCNSLALLPVSVGILVRLSGGEYELWLSGVLRDRCSSEGQHFGLSTCRRSGKSNLLRLQQVTEGSLRVCT